MSEQCFKPGSLPVQQWEIDGLTFVDADGTGCYSDGDMIRGEHGKVLDPESPEVKAFIQEWKIEDLGKLNLGTAKAVIRGYRQAEFFAASGDVEQTKSALKIAKRQAPWTGAMSYDATRAKDLLSWAQEEQARTQALKDPVEAMLQQYFPSWDLGSGLLLGLAMMLPAGQN